MPEHKGSIWNEETTNMIMSILSDINKAIEMFGKLPETVQDSIRNIKDPETGKSIIYLLECCDSAADMIKWNYNIK